VKKYNSIGKIVGTYGFQGELVLLHNLGKKTSLKGLQAVYIEENKDSMLPYFIEKTKIKNEAEIYLKLEGISTKEAGKRFNQKQIWLAEDDFKRYVAGSAAITLLGFQLVNEGKELGEILEVIEQPHQVLCTIEWAGKEALIPLHAETLQKIDKKNRKVHVILPDGLLDVFAP